jgi:hypothetical protein
MLDNFKKSISPKISVENLDLDKIKNLFNNK